MQRIVATRKGDVIEVEADNKDIPFTAEASDGCKIIIK